MSDAPQKTPGREAAIGGRPKVGDAAERSRTTTMRDVEPSTEMTGDCNPLRCDRALADRSVRGKLIVQGGVTSGILDAPVAEDLPGPGTAFLGCEWKFLKAVEVDETITGRVEIVSMREDEPLCTPRTTVRDAEGNICLDGTAATFAVPLEG